MLNKPVLCGLVVSLLLIPLGLGLIFKDMFLETAGYLFQHSVASQSAQTHKPSIPEASKPAANPAATTATPTSKAPSSQTTNSHASSQPQQSSQPTTPPAPSTPPPCAATSMSSLNACITLAQQSKTDAIAISGMFSCAAANACAINLSNIKRDGGTQLHIYGVSGTTSGLNKTDTSVYALVNLSSSNNILLSNLTLNQTTSAQNDAACASGTAADCASTIFVNQSDNITLDQLVLENADFGLTVVSSTNITLKNSTVDHSYEFGAWLGSSGNNGINLLNDVIKNTGSNGVLVGGKNILIQGSTFQHNHHNAVFWSCGAGGNQPCSGGQLFIGSASNVTLDGDAITGGIMDDPYNGQTYEVAGFHASGVEIDNNVQGLTIKHSDINTNTGAGVVANASLASLANVVITNDRMYSNLNPVYSPSTQLGPDYDISWANNSTSSVTVANNCYTLGCVIP